MMIDLTHVDSFFGARINASPAMASSSSNLSARRASDSRPNTRSSSGGAGSRTSSKNANNNITFEKLDLLPPDPLLNLNTLFANCKDPKKVNLGVGAYRDSSGQPKVLDVVRKVELEFASQAKLNHEYLPILGLDDFCSVSRNLMFGNELVQSLGNRITSMQTLSGTGAVRVGMELMKVINPNATFYIPNQTWPNHPSMLNAVGLKFETYRYFDEFTSGVDFPGLLADLNRMPEGSILLLHACAHNPTGADPTGAQWQQIADVCVRRNLFPFFDVAYQGYVTGDPAKDGAALRYFATLNIDMLACQSYAKIFGLYGERVGALHIVVSPRSASVDETVAAIRSQVARIARTMYSNPPAQGARIVARVLGDDRLRQEWLNELRTMAERIMTMRRRLRAELERIQAGGAGRSWAHVTTQQGMFCFTGISREAAIYLVENRSIFLTERYLNISGRISMAGLNENNVEYVAQSIRDALAATQTKL